jgi:hypothetical protein
MTGVRLHIVLALTVWVAAFLAYLSTVAPTTLLWDCGEFIAAAYTLGVPHPPGAPLYILVGRIFSMLPVAEDIGMRVNLISVVAGSFTAMLTYLIIVRLIRRWKQEPNRFSDKLALHASGIIGALAFAFSYSQWFNSVEAEVYGISVLITALVIWLALRWMDTTGDRDRIVFLIAFIIGLATGVHQLSLLVLPAVAMLFLAGVDSSARDGGWRPVLMMLAAGAAGVFAVGVVNNGMLRGLPMVADRFGAVGLLLVVVLLLAVIYWAIVKSHRVIAVVTCSVFFVLLGQSVYLHPYLRAQAGPPLNYSAPATPAALADYVGRKEYGEWSIVPRRAPLWEYQINMMYLRYFAWQFIGKGTTMDEQGRITETFSLRGLHATPFLLGMIGLVYHFRRDWRGAASILALFLMTGLAIVIYLNQIDPQPRERDYSYTGSFLTFSLWVGMGVAALVKMNLRAFMSRSPKAFAWAASVLCVVLLLLVPGRMLLFNYHENDRSGNFLAYDYAYNTLMSCDPDAILFTQGDNGTFPLWFLQQVHNIRTDVRVVNLGLLNTPWYIRQMRDGEPRVPMSLTDGAVDQLKHQAYRDQRLLLEVSREILDAELRLAGFTPDDERVHTMEASLKSARVLRVQDQMVWEIVEQNNFQRPICFALSVAAENAAGLNGHLRLNGMVFRLLPIAVPPGVLDPVNMHELLFGTFQYRNLNNPGVFYDYHELKMVGNYRVVFLALANDHLARGEHAEALRVLDHLDDVMPESVIPAGDSPIGERVAALRMQAQRLADPE